MPTRNGKVANLPNAIREQLNLRLLEGETGEPLGVGAGGMSGKGARELAVWLNALPEVQSILGSQFNGSAISEVNLTHWRQGGYLQWITERECFHAARALAEGDGDLASTGLSAERLLNVLTVRFGQLLMRWDISTDNNVSESAAFAQIAKKARILQGISRSVLAIHRLQSQSALKKSGSSTSSASTHASPQPDATPCRAEASNSEDGPGHAKAAKRVGGSPSRPEQNIRPNYGIVESTAEKQANIESRAAQMAALAAQIQSLNDEEALRDVANFSSLSRPSSREILSGSIAPSKLSSTSFNLDHDLQEILKAV